MFSHVKQSDHLRLFHSTSSHHDRPAGHRRHSLRWPPWTIFSLRPIAGLACCGTLPFRQRHPSARITVPACALLCLSASALLCSPGAALICSALLRPRQPIYIYTAESLSGSVVSAYGRRKVTLDSTVGAYYQLTSPCPSAPPPLPMVAPTTKPPSLILPPLSIYIRLDIDHLRRCHGSTSLPFCGHRSLRDGMLELYIRSVIMSHRVAQKYVQQRHVDHHQYSCRPCCFSRRATSPLWSSNSNKLSTSPADNSHGHSRLRQNSCSVLDPD